MMSVVLGFTDFVLADLPPDDRRRRDLERVRTAAGRAATVTAQLLAFSRQQMLQPTVLRPADLLVTLEPVLHRLLGADRTLVLDVAPDTGHIVADRGQLEQVLINLALNARDAMGPGGQLTVAVRPILLDSRFTARHPEAASLLGSCVMLEVSDTGHGIDETTRERIFEPFFTTKPPGQGTGLGLAVVHGIVRGHRGGVRVESAPQLGSTFSVVLPAIEQPAEPLSRLVEPEPAWRGAGVVLLADDEELVRDVTETMLRQLGFEVVTVADGRQAVEAFTADPSRFDLVLLDLTMPVMTGTEAVLAIRAIRPDARILMMSGFNEENPPERAAAEPPLPFLHKPFTLKGLRDILQDALQRQRG
jgi:two-component system cell cycle sensor histidine kinase/response regulator CckA